MIKRDELSNPDSCMSRALSHERTFVLLTRDEIAPKAIREWCRLRCLHGKNVVSDPQIREALRCADLMDSERRDIKRDIANYMHGIFAPQTETDSTTPIWRDCSNCRNPTKAGACPVCGAAE